jgi:hypothetical protein
MKKRMQIYALSIAGPFGYWLASGRTIEPYGKKEIELRTWGRSDDFLKKETMVLIHISSTTEYDHHFHKMDFTLEQAPKFSFIGAAVLKEIILYDQEKLWKRDRRHTCWVGDEDYQTIYAEYGGKLYGHVFTEFLLFDPPILDVPGDRGYWRPNPKKVKQFERQQVGFAAAIERIKEMRGTAD